MVLSAEGPSHTLRVMIVINLIMVIIHFLGQRSLGRDFIASLSETKRIPEADSELDMQLEEIKIFVQI